jgi:Cu(I)-responsive transcriptional regulator
MHLMNIGQASQASGVSAKMIRHYEAVGLVPAAARTEAGYRQYSATDVHTLRFIAQARDLGFSIAEIGQLVGLWQNRARPSRKVKALAEAHIQDLERKAQDLLAMKGTLEHLVRCCHGDDRPECPILDTLAGHAGHAEAVGNAVAADAPESHAPPGVSASATGRATPLAPARRPRVR